MEKNTIKCSSKEDQDIEAISYCGECKVYMCVNCDKFHSKLLSSHQTYSVNEQLDDIFSEFCQEKNHSNKLEFYCKTHNILCCAACTSKIGKDGIGSHKDCDVCFIEDIKKEKENKIKSNIEYLEELSKNLNDLINNFEDFRVLYERTVKNKEDLKMKIQDIFTVLRNDLNKREEELLLEVENYFNDICCEESLIKEVEDLPNKINLSLEKGKKIDINNNNKLALFINNCINMENNVLDINKVVENIKKFKNGSYKTIKFDYDEKFNLIKQNIKSLGKISYFYFDSLIVKDDINQQKTVTNWISQKIKNNVINFEKIFTMSINGNSSKDFHKFCDNKGPTLTLIKTTKDKTFGGFTPLNWEYKGDSLIDENNQTFVFSLNSMKKFDLISKERTAIYCNWEYGPSFGASDLSIESNMKKGETYANEYTNFFSEDNLELLGEKGENNSFDIKEIEVFTVIY